MSPAENFIQWADCHESRFPPCALLVLVKAVAKCQREETNRIATTQSGLADEFGTSRDSIRVASRNLAPLLHISPDGANWLLPEDWFAFPCNETLRLPDPPSAQLSFSPLSDPVEIDDHKRVRHDHKPGNQARQTRQKRRRNGERFADCLVRRQKSAEKPGNSLPGNQAAPFSTGAKQQGISPLASLVVAQNALLPGNQAQIPSNSKVLVRSSSIEGLSVLGRIEELAAEIAATHVVEKHQREDADKLRNALDQYMQQFHDPREWDDQPPDDEILARCLRLASLGVLIADLRTLGKADKRGIQTYGWFVTTLAHRLCGIPKTVLKAALSTEKRNHRQTQKPKPSHEGGEAPDPCYADQTIQKVMTAGRRLW
jgi:hypothetical protein